MSDTLKKYLRKLRIDHDEKLSQMAEKLEVSSSYLSLIESGERSVPRNFIEKLCKAYDLTLNDKEKLDFLSATAPQQGFLWVDIASLSPDDQKLMFRFSRSIKTLSNIQKKEIEAVLDTTGEQAC